MASVTEQGGVFSVLAMRPATTPAFMTDAWLGALHWALGSDDVFAAFQRDTGCRWKPPTTGLERFIDEATGHTTATLKEFIEWFNVNVWGEVGWSA